MAKDSKNSLFESAEREKIQQNAPLAVRMRPRDLDEFAGQQHFIGPGKLLRRMLDAGRLTSVIFYGPPGVGKTSLARLIATLTEAKFHYISAPAASVKDIREIIDTAKSRLMSSGPRTLLFIDEIHRFNRAQQDVLLDDVENGVVTLIGATTENPFFSVNSPLISRSTIFNFEPLDQSDIITLLRRAICDPERGFGKLDIDADDDALEYLALMCDGDARRALTALEVAILSQQKTGGRGQKIRLDLTIAQESIQKKSIRYDSDTHYDLASALQKSMRGSDPDATTYWLARMIAGGEDPRFIARRIAVCASEDVGNADPMAVVVAASAVQIAELVGMPEAQLALSQAAIYVACAPKSNASASAIWQAVSDVKAGRTIPVPAHLKDAHYKGAKKMGYGTGYKYPHKSPTGFVPQDYLGEELGKHYYEPKEVGREKTVKQHLQKLRKYLK
ncbi:Replication-associated recombination protein A [Anaerohalosphaera lusitana]|uniref:Replication-associated recombination protein A n=1 Tax=Anaerohalosphaera lusitana TaxID=1936003 RepID=A0A1U9NLP7_9BACT|nr:replication-associated recombination protein A [Anaerohalosphaera lusitana]AQT68416.1 Replication-associated recombination protein A [Anaerohalosphaera lusitana]